MIGRVSVIYAMRSLWRNPRRTLLSILGVGIGCGLAVVATSYYSGAADTQIRAIAESGTGHLRVVPEGWLETRENTLRLADTAGAIEAARNLEWAEVAAPRAYVQALLAFGTRTSVVQMTGVDPEAEERINRIVSRSQIEGRYLDPDDNGHVVIGKALAKRLDVALDDDLMVTLSAGGEMQGAMLRIVGVLDAGSDDLELTVCHVTLRKVEDLTGKPGAGEVTVLLEDTDDIPVAQKALEAEIPKGDHVVTWQQVSPGFAAGIEGDQGFISFLIVIVMIVVALGIMSAQLTAQLERRREFGVLLAIGMKSPQIVALVFMEAVVTGVAGGLVGLLLGGAMAYYLATEGIDLSTFLGDESAVAGVLLDPIIYADFGPWLIWFSMTVGTAAALASAIYPASFAARVDPASALREV